MAIDFQARLIQPAPTADLAGIHPDQLSQRNLNGYIRRVVQFELSKRRSRGRRGVGSDRRRRCWWMHEKCRRGSQANAQLLVNAVRSASLLNLSLLLRDWYSRVAVDREVPVVAMVALVAAQVVASLSYTKFSKF